MSSKSLADKGGAKNPPNHGVKNPGKCANQAPGNVGKGGLGKVVASDPLKVKPRRS